MGSFVPTRERGYEGFWEAFLVPTLPRGHAKVITTFAPRPSSQVILHN